MKRKIDRILDFMQAEASYDFSGCSYDMLERRIKLRVAETRSNNFEDYLMLLQKDQNELQNLMHTLTIKVSYFFRNPLDFEITNYIIGGLLALKSENEESMRIWCAGCATGDEAYSIAILLAEHKKNYEVDYNLFATDIDDEIIAQAMKAEFNESNLQYTRLGLINKYFRKKRMSYILDDEIRNMVNFSVFDLVSENNIVPTASVYGDFDLVLCRNVLIYYNEEFQNKIMEKLYKSLRRGGYLLLGEAEKPTEKYADKFFRAAPHSRIYKKNKL